MKIYKVLRVAAAASLLSGFIASGGCTRDEVLPLEEATAPAQSGCVSIEHALEALSRFNDGEALTRTAEVPAVAHVDVLMRSDVEPATRTADAGQDAPLCYIAQFEGGGYAILGANDKQAPVVAYVPKGSLTAQELADAKAAADRGEDHETPTYINACVVEYLQDAAEGLVENEAEIAENVETRTDIPIHWEPLKETLMFTEWDLWAPYNGSCGTDRFGNPNSAGCVAIALSQIMIYNMVNFGIGPNSIHHPTFYTQGDVYYPVWLSLNKTIDGATPPNNQFILRDLADFIHEIGRSVGMIYKSDESTAFDNDAAKFLNQVVKYKNVSLRTATATDMKKMIATNKTPVFASGNSHAWVIDGWRETKEIFTNAAGGSITINYNYFYCRYGFGGESDGWYLFQLASLKDPYKLTKIIYYTLQ